MNLKFLFFFLILTGFVFATDDTPVTHDEIIGSHHRFGSRAWRKPDFDGQGRFLGFTKNSFAVPKGMESRVNFWKRIYTEVTSEQGLIHHAEKIDQVYSVVDFTDLKSSSLSKGQIEKEKQSRVDALKKIVLLEKPELSMTDLRFQLGQKDRMEVAIFLSGRYIEEFEEIFKQNQLPIELVRLVFVESSFNVLARSKVGASGLWQIMPSNARPHRMMSEFIDKRNHPVEATKLAAKILRSNYGMLEDWPLAVTGYNHGPTGVMKMTQKYKSRDLADLIENVNSRKSFGFASRNFYASFLAALDVESNADKYFKNVKWSKAIPGEPLKLKQNVPFDLLKDWFSGDLVSLQIYNPHLSRSLLNGKHSVPKGAWITIPEDSYLKAMADLAKLRRRIASH